MDHGSTERPPIETPAPEDYYELTNSQPPAACVGCQAWSKAQGSGSCPVGVRRFKSCPTHPFRSVDHQERPQIDSAAVSFIRPSVPLGHWRDGDLDHTTREGEALLPRPQVGSPSMYEDRHSIGTHPVRSTTESTHPTHLCVQPSRESHKGDDSGGQYPSAAAFTFWLYFWEIRPLIYKPQTVHVSYS